MLPVQERQAVEPARPQVQPTYQLSFEPKTAPMLLTPRKNGEIVMGFVATRPLSLPPLMNTWVSVET